MADLHELFAQGVAHDLRGPLSVLEGELEVVLEQELPEDAMDGIQAARNIAHTMRDWFEDMVQLDAGRYPESVSLAGIAHEVATGVQAKLLIQDVDAVQADPLAVRRILANLIRNAVQHGRGVVSIQRYEDGFMVRDEGTGLPPDICQALEDDGDIPRRGSSGLGLTLTRALVESEGWKLKTHQGFPLISGCFP